MNKTSEEPPTVEITFGGSFTFYTETIHIDDSELYLSLVLPTHRKAKQLDPGKGYEWMRNYVQKKLLASEVIREDDANPANPFGLTTHIVGAALRCGNIDFPNGEGMPCINQANLLIEQAIQHPPPPIDDKHFSLKAFVKTQ